MGVPREPVHLAGNAATPRLVSVNTGRDHTRTMTEFSQQRARELEAVDLSSYVFKKDSPSCGMERVRVFNHRGAPSRHGVGMFARIFMQHFPLIPVEEEGRLK